ncbi:hypothetical protein TVAGG3_0289180, partial [Trichomonas vaginalis G3]
MSKTALYNTKTLSGKDVILTKTSVIIDNRHYRFDNEFEEEVVHMSASISGHFIAVINTAGELFLITIGDQDGLYVDQISPDTNFKYTQFSCNETVLFAITNNNILQFYKVLLPEFLSEFLFYTEFPAESFTVMEANGIIRIAYNTEDGQKYKCFYLPDNFRVNPQGAKTSLKEADPSYLSLFEPALPTVNEVFQENEEEEGEIEQLEPELTLEDAARQLLLKNQQLHQKQNELMSRRNQLANSINELNKRGKRIREREDAARQRMQSLYARIQKLIESRDSYGDVDSLTNKFAQSEKKLNELN